MVVAESNLLLWPGQSALSEAPKKSLRRCYESTPGMYVFAKTWPVSEDAALNSESVPDE